MNLTTNKPWLYQIIPLIIWVLLLVLPFTLNPGNIPKEIHHIFLVNIFISNVLMLCVFYAHTYWAYPMLKYKGALWYSLSLFLILLVCFLCLVVFSPHPSPADLNKMTLPPPVRLGGFINIISPSIAILCSFCYRIIIDNAAREQKIKERETIHLRTELNFLRSQISPHFMFNVLNNLVALARKKSDLLEPAIINLSQLMRYMLYESDDNSVPLAKEIEYLKNYIDLQLLRFGDAVKVSVSVTGDANELSIEPMLLIPFVENAFKHGTGMLDDPLILISLTITSPKPTIQFSVINAISPVDGSKDNSSGIGLGNVKRRLAILYPTKHQLTVNDTNGVFTSVLTIQLV